ncbi:MAG: aminotransferase class IV [Ferruginibacter sp.]
MIYFNFNGKTLQEGTPITGPDNRGLRYGDGLFETIKYKNGSFILPDEHFSRLWKGMQLLQFEPSKIFTAEMLQAETLQLLKKNNHPSARVRISVIRGNGGLHDAENLAPNYIIQSWPLAETNASLNENGLQLCIYTGAKKSIDSFSNLKHNNFLPYLMGALYAKREQCNDAVILNTFGRIADTSIANIFLINKGVVYTPSLKEGCVAGVMRKFIIQQLLIGGYEVKETEITILDLKDADELFLTNSIYNFRWVAGLDGKKYSNPFTRKIFKNLCQTNPAIFC